MVSGKVTKYPLVSTESKYTFTIMCFKQRNQLLLIINEGYAGINNWIPSMLFTYKGDLKI